MTNLDAPARRWADDVQLVLRMDVLDAATVEAAVEGADAVYLIATKGEDFTTTDRISAENMAWAVAAAGVELLVYLSGLVPDVPEQALSEHITSRHGGRTHPHRCDGRHPRAHPARRDRHGVRVDELRGGPPDQQADAGAHGAGVDVAGSNRSPSSTSSRRSRVRCRWRAPLARTTSVARNGCRTRSFSIATPASPGSTRPRSRCRDCRPTSSPCWPVPSPAIPGSTVPALVESLHHDMVCHDVDWTYDLLPDAWLRARRGRRVVRPGAARARLDPAAGGARPPPQPDARRPGVGRGLEHDERGSRCRHGRGPVGRLGPAGRMLGAGLGSIPFS